MISVLFVQEVIPDEADGIYGGSEGGCAVPGTGASRERQLLVQGRLPVREGQVLRLQHRLEDGRCLVQVAGGDRRHLPRLQGVDQEDREAGHDNWQSSAMTRTCVAISKTSSATSD